MFKIHKPTEQDREEREVLRKTNGRAHARPLNAAGTSSVWWRHMPLRGICDWGTDQKVGGGGGVAIAYYTFEPI